MNYQKSGTKPKAAKLYHSEIAQSPNGVELQFVSDTKDSKFADGNPWVLVRRRDGTETMMILENDDVRSVVDQTPQKKWVTLKGEGKADGAWLIVEDDAGPIFAGKTTAPERPAANAQETTGFDPSVLVHDVTTLTVQAVVELRKASILIEGEAVARIWNTLLIALDRRS